jgi:hypothetical protein
MKNMCEIDRFSWHLNYEPMYINIYQNFSYAWPHFPSRSIYNAFPEVLLKAAFGDNWLTSQNYDSKENCA